MTPASKARRAVPPVGDPPPTGAQGAVRRDCHRFALRTIRHGRVRVAGRDWQPTEPWPAHLNGLRAAFYLYSGTDLLSLWGTEAAYRDPEADWPGPFVDDAGVFRWQWWRPVETQP